MSHIKMILLNVSNGYVFILFGFISNYFIQVHSTLWSKWRDFSGWTRLRVLETFTKTQSSISYFSNLILILTKSIFLITIFLGSKWCFFVFRKSNFHSSWSKFCERCRRIFRFISLLRGRWICIWYKWVIWIRIWDAMVSPSKLDYIKSLMIRIGKY